MRRARCPTTSPASAIYLEAAASRALGAAAPAARRSLNSAAQSCSRVPFALAVAASDLSPGDAFVPRPRPPRPPTSRRPTPFMVRHIPDAAADTPPPEIACLRRRPTAALLVRPRPRAPEGKHEHGRQPMAPGTCGAAPSAPAPAG